MENLFTPWRYAFVSVKQPEDGCFFCAAARRPDDPERLVVHLGEHHLVMLNRYPYTNGHLMVAPLEHQCRAEQVCEAARLELWPLVLKAQRVLESAFSPDGFNLGMNLGSAAGAGVPDHYHFHLVPRWKGDTSFTSVVGGVRLVPEDLMTTWKRLRALFAEEAAE